MCARLMEIDWVHSSFVKEMISTLFLEMISTLMPIITILLGNFNCFLYIHEAADSSMQQLINSHCVLVFQFRKVKKRGGLIDF